MPDYGNFYGFLIKTKLSKLVLLLWIIMEILLRSLQDFINNQEKYDARNKPEGTGFKTRADTKEVLEKAHCSRLIR